MKITKYLLILYICFQVNIRLLDQNPQPSEDEIKTGLDGNICRCSGYLKIIEAVQHAGQQLKKKSK